MHSSSIVLFKDFLNKTNSIKKQNGDNEERGQPVHRIYMKHLIKEIKKNKLPIKQVLQEIKPKMKIEEKQQSEARIHKSMRVTSQARKSDTPIFLDDLVQK